MKQRPRVLVVGAQMDSLGRYVYEASLTAGYDATTAGLTEQETHRMDVTDPHQVREVMRRVAPEHVVCTAGINEETVLWDSPADASYNLERILAVNAIGPMNVLSAWHSSVLMQGDALLPGPKHFVAISSNSAWIARTNSAGYCMSKAALSMGIRVAARELAGTECVVRAYEPGWLEGTPMSEKVNLRLPLGAQPHRIPGGSGVDPAALAAQIVCGLRYGGSEVNGTVIRIDGGEQ